MSIESIVERIRHAGLLPVVRADSAERAIELSRALVRGGIESLEITLTVPDALRVIELVSRELGDRALVGAGTVLSAADAKRCIDAGAHFVVSPGAVAELIETCHAAGAAVMPGALTPSEVIAAWQAGADMVKVFPCSALGGAKYLAALKAPLPHVRLLPTGGVTLETLASYLEAGAAALGVGAALADVELLEREGADAVTQLATSYVEKLRVTRQRLSSTTG